MPLFRIFSPYLVNSQLIQKCIHNQQLFWKQQNDHKKRRNSKAYSSRIVKSNWSYSYSYPYVKSITQLVCLLYIVKSNWSYSYFNKTDFQIASLTCFVTSSSYKTAVDYVYIFESFENWEELGKIFETKRIGKSTFVQIQIFGNLKGIELKSSTVQLYIPIQIPEIQTACPIYSRKKGWVYGWPGDVIYVIPIGFKTV